jgi:hypothetical protein
MFFGLVMVSVFLAGDASRAEVVGGQQDLTNCCPVCMDLASIQCREAASLAWAQSGAGKPQKSGKIEAEIAK